MIEPITDPADPRVADYRSLKDRRLAADGGRFIAESERVVRRLLASGLRVRSILATETRLRALGAELREEIPAYLGSQALLDGVAGFHVHRGCLAVGERPATREVPGGARTVVVLEDLVDVDNLGGVLRNAAAFGADAVVLSPRCADPFYRKAIRVSLASVFFIPVVRLARWPDDLAALRDRLGLTLLGMTPAEGATPLPLVRRPPKVAVLLGSEGPGLSEAAKRLCDLLVKIPMAPGADSLNVATAGAVALYHLTRPAPAP